MTQKIHILNGYKVTLMSFGNDIRLFITAPNGYQIYGHRRSSAVGYLTTAKQVIREAK